MSKNKIISDFLVFENTRLNESFSLLKLRPTNNTDIPSIFPGQFVQIKVPDSDKVFLRRPISVCNYIEENKELWLLIRRAGDGTNKLCDVLENQILNLILPLGNGFSLPKKNEKMILIGGGAGIAPLLYFGKFLVENGFAPSFLLGFRSSNDIMLLDEYKRYGNVYLSTEDGSAGEKGLITLNSILESHFDTAYCCGPFPMMKAIREICKKRSIKCEVSLENKMACGIGVCLCCVEKTQSGNKCVCSEGPVFNINQLVW